MDCFWMCQHEYLWSYNFKSLEIIFCVCLCVCCVCINMHIRIEIISREIEREKERYRGHDILKTVTCVCVCVCVCWVLYNTNICISPVSLAIYLHFIQKFIESWHMWNVPECGNVYYDYSRGISWFHFFILFSIIFSYYIDSPLSFVFLSKPLFSFLFLLFFFLV